MENFSTCPYRNVCTDHQFGLGPEQRKCFGLAANPREVLHCPEKLVESASTLRIYKVGGQEIWMQIQSS